MLLGMSGGEQVFDSVPEVEEGLEDESTSESKMLVNPDSHTEHTARNDRMMSACEGRAYDQLEMGML